MTNPLTFNSMQPSYQSLSLRPPRLRGESFWPTAKDHSPTAPPRCYHLRSCEEPGNTVAHQTDPDLRSGLYSMRVRNLTTLPPAAASEYIPCPP